MFGFIKKEFYINQLTTTYSMIYECDDYVSIDNLRKNYSAKELKKILTELKILSDGNQEIDRYTAVANNPFKE